MDDEKAKNTILDLFNLPDKKAVQKFCREATITNQEFASVAMAAHAGILAPYKYARHFAELVPEHLIPAPGDSAALAANGVGPMGPAAQKFMNKVTQIFRDRRMFGAHLFYMPSKEIWHLLYFDQRDMSTDGNHWKQGSHIHYSRESYSNDPLDMVWERILATPPKPPASEHVRYVEVRERGFVGPGDSE